MAFVQGRRIEKTPLATLCLKRTSDEPCTLFSYVNDNLVVLGTGRSRNLGALPQLLPAETKSLLPCRWTLDGHRPLKSKIAVFLNKMRYDDAKSSM